MKYYISAGEASGDLHGSNLMKALQLQDVNAVFRFWGGDLMQQVGGTLIKHYKELAFMGFIEVIMNLRTITKNLSLCKQDIEAYNPDVIIFIDYPGFNLRIAKWAKTKGFKTHYYISPQIWAWKENRITAIKRDIDKMYVILPFEKSFYEDKHKFPVEFVGHPLIDAISNRVQVDEYEFRAQHELSNKPIIALLPGSRKQEIIKMMPTFLEVINRFPQYKFIVAAAPGIDFDWYQQFLKDQPVLLVQDQTYALLKNSFAAIVTSGTATLETALFSVPQMVCYRSSFLSFQIAKRIITLPFISLVNLIMDKEVVSEILQNDFTVKRIEQELKLITESEKRTQLLEDYKLLHQKLYAGGASTKTAVAMVEFLQKKQ